MYEVSEELEKLAEEVIEQSAELQEYDQGMLTKEFPRIAYLWSDSEKKDAKSGKVIYADTSKVTDKNKVVMYKDFIITFYRPNCEELSESQMRILMLHELLHVGITEDGDFFVRKHDIDEFQCIADNYGLHWADNKE